MPLFEYECKACGHQFMQLILKAEEEKKLACPECSKKRLKKLISRCAYHQSEADRLAGFDDSRPQGLEFYKDSRNVGLKAQKMAQKAGVDLGDQFQETLEKARTGKILDDYEK